MGNRKLYEKLNILPYILCLISIFGIVYFAMFDFLPKQFVSNMKNQEYDKKTKVTWTTWGNPGELKRFETITHKFNEQAQDIEVEMKPLSTSNYERKIMVDLMSGTAPDVFYASEEFYHRLVGDKKLLNISNYFNTWSVKNDFLPILVNSMAEDNGQIYGIPVDFNIPVIYFNEDLFESKGLKTPVEYYKEDKWDWDNLEKCIYALSSSGGQQGPPVYGMVLENWWGITYSWIYQNGGQVFDENGRCALNSDKAKEAIKFLKRMIDNNGLMCICDTQNDFSHIMLFKQQRAAMIQAGRWVLPDFKNSIHNFKWDIAPLPEGPDGLRASSITTAFMCINADAKYKDEAWKFVEFFCGPEGQRIRLLNSGNAIPSLKSLIPMVMEEDKDHHFEYYYEDLNVGRVIPKAQIIHPGLGNSIHQSLEQIWLGKDIDIDKVLDDLTNDVNRVIDNENAKR